MFAGEKKIKNECTSSRNDEKLLWIPLGNGSPETRKGIPKRKPKQLLKNSEQGMGKGASFLRSIRRWRFGLHFPSAVIPWIIL
ncbi:unnamed protein product [Amoebophrya sp. A25]|nr:unnamed protein product [Amoebophrya sp. A25]|eukprot:GSA25T00019142001.1